MSPDIIHNTGDIQLPNESVNNQADMSLSYEISTTLDNGKYYNHADEAEFIQHTLSKGSDDILW